MKMSEIAGIIKSMRGRMPESSRTLLAQKFIQLFGVNLTNTLKDAKLQEWVDKGGVPQFFDQCELLSGLPWVDHEISVHDTDLAAFINRWMNVDNFRQPGKDDYEPFTEEMHSVRFTIIEELKGLYEAQKRMTDYDANGENPETD